MYVVAKSYSDIFQWSFTAPPQIPIIHKVSLSLVIGVPASCGDSAENKYLAIFIRN
jgi:hypothetical protein